MNINVTIEIPAEIEEKARAAGLLTGEKIFELIEAELERQRQEAWQRLSETMDKLSASVRAEYGDLSDDEAQALINQWLEETDTEDEANARG